MTLLDWKRSSRRVVGSTLQSAKEVQMIEMSGLRIGERTLRAMVMNLKTTMLANMCMTY